MKDEKIEALAQFMFDITKDDPRLTKITAAEFKEFVDCVLEEGDGEVWLQDKWYEEKILETYEWCTACKAEQYNGCYCNSTCDIVTRVKMKIPDNDIVVLDYIDFCCLPGDDVLTSSAVEVYKSYLRKRKVSR